MPESSDRGRSKRRWRRPSVYDVARQAGVSHMTVSRVLNDQPNIRDATRDRVLNAIEELNYTRNNIAHALATRTGRRIGVLVDAPIENGPNNTLRALEQAARTAGYAVSAFGIDDGDAQIRSGVMELATQGIDALCVIAPRASSLDALREQPTGLPVVVIKSEADAMWHTVGVDQRAGARLAVEHLLGLGHVSLVHLAGPQDWLDARERQQAWQDTLRDASGVRGTAVVGEWTSDSGYQYASTAEWGDVTAVFAANDQIALGVIHGLAERGIRVPEDISVVGFDDLSEAKHFSPPLTTVRQDFDALGERALECIVAAINGSDDLSHSLVRPSLIVRESTAPVPS
ncbi:LacI family DNA-binding transcriptional regulator [Microbacterium enclense]|uniref:LacI family DNA-binding transcriptional regulator n=1 Tax=Microbacterium enclense TaxID=993073 RepID=UPI00203B392F|nr:LacI family DNA-binding transcriptional regulator [Microbacterium enclense]MCM3613943.1 LacI family DNA-binding transcriptional regulator [Microbacterium enclense]